MGWEQAVRPFLLGDGRSTPFLDGGASSISAGTEQPGPQILSRSL